MYYIICTKTNSPYNIYVIKTDFRDKINKRCLHFDDDSNNDWTHDTTKLASGFDIG